MNQNRNVKRMLKKVEAENKKFQKMLDGMGPKHTKLSTSSVETEAQRMFKRRMQQKQKQYDKEQSELDRKIAALDQKLVDIKKENDRLVFVSHK